MEARLAKVELAMADTREGVDLIEQGMEKGLEDLREQIQDLREGVLGSQVQPVSHEEFMSFQDKVMTMFASVESRMEAWLHAWMSETKRSDKSWPSTRLRC